MIDPVNNMIIPHVRYYIPERFATFQLILTHYKNEVQSKEIGGDIKWSQYLIVSEAIRFTRIKLIGRELMTGVLRVTPLYHMKKSLCNFNIIT